MNITGVALAALTIAIAPPVINDAQSTHPGTPTTRVERGSSEKTQRHGQTDPLAPVVIRAPPKTPGGPVSAGLAMPSVALAVASLEGVPMASLHPTPFELVIEVRDMARVPQKVMSQTKAEVERTFLEVGVRIVWADLGRTPREQSVPLRLFVVGSTSPTVPPDEDPRAAALGVAPESGNWAQVFYGRVAAAVARRQVSISVVLAHVMAHELGHLLLPPNSHSPVGVMRQAVDLNHPTFRRFTDEQARLIRAALLNGRRYAWSCSQ